jgi:hypothetical protein
MIIHPLPVDSAEQTGATHLAEITYLDLTAAGNTQTINIAGVVAKQMVTLIFARLAAAFVSSDGTLVSTAVTVGDTGSATRYLASMELNAVGTTVFMKAGALAYPTGFFVYTATDTLQIAFTATAAKLLNTHTAGKLLLFFNIQEGRQGASGVVGGTGNF